MTEYRVGLSDGLWIGVVFNDAGLVITLCSEQTKEQAINWCEHFIRTGEELPDAFNRAN